MNTNELVEAMVQRLGTELKGLLEQVQGGQLPASAVETVVRQELWHFGGQAVAVLLEALDQTLVGLDQCMTAAPRRSSRCSDRST